MWGSFVWNTFDFGAAHRTEGDRPGIHDKGLATRDRKVKKDAFYFYKANWNVEPMVYIADRRCVNRVKELTDVMVFLNCKEVILSVNGKEIGGMQPYAQHICIFKDIRLEKGENKISAIAVGKSKKPLQDDCCWKLQ